MKVVKALILEDHPWLRSKSLIRLLHILNTDGLNARMVGGCVRDALLGREIIDIDLACSLTPEGSRTRLENAKIKVIPTGLKHGTITAVIDKRSYEITTLRRDVETDGRHAKVVFIDDWAEDARRRDFTFNALYLDGDGSLYDPCGGLADLKAGRVRFIGDAHKRIQEDALRILRFFRFAAQIGEGKLDPIGLAACIRNKGLIDNLSGERLAQEIFKILQAENLLPIIEVMADSGILEKVLPGHKPLDKFNDFVRLENDLGRCDILMRLSCLCAGDVSRHLKLSNSQAKTLRQYAGQDIAVYPGMNEKDIRKSVYLSGRQVFIFALLQSWAGDEVLRYAENWTIPTMPVQGRDLIRAGFAAGPALGVKLKSLETAWVESDFRLSKQELLVL
ncbi:MAG: hypothetical protein COB49_03975 [Alphaproteobacteria bacterium]|nr:MAG: hypothetical protein COB49_03975 [Alphaproteobacteria bacterium]